MLRRVRNCVPHSEGNNDLLEFTGDRVANLVVALLVEKVKISRAHHKAVRQVICSNDTFGRLAYYLRFDDHAVLSEHDERDVDGWDPGSSVVPPKVLADLFEAYVGAVYIEHGWKTALRWLSGVLRPAIDSATCDYWLSSSHEKIFASALGRARTHIPPETRTQGKLLDYIEYKRGYLLEHGREAVEALPESTLFTFDSKGRLREPHGDWLDVAVHVVNMWICKILLKHWPEYHRATAKAAHILSAVTGLLASEKVMAFLGRALSLSARIDHKLDHTDTPHDTAPSLNQFALACKATIGCFYHIQPERAEGWGEKWFRFVVIRAHDIIVQERRYRPIISPASREDTQARPSLAVGQQHDEDESVSALTTKLATFTLVGGDCETAQPDLQSQFHAELKDDSNSHIRPPSSSARQSPSTGIAALDKTKWRPIPAMPSEPGSISHRSSPPAESECKGPDTKNSPPNNTNWRPINSPSSDVTVPLALPAEKSVSRRDPAAEANLGPRRKTSLTALIERLADIDLSDKSPDAKPPADLEGETSVHAAGPPVCARSETSLSYTSEPALDKRKWKPIGILTGLRSLPSYAASDDA